MNSLIQNISKQDGVHHLFQIPTYSHSYIHIVLSLLLPVYISTYSICINHNQDIISSWKEYFQYKTDSTT